jgi:hypothetical protein
MSSDRLRVGEPNWKVNFDNCKTTVGKYNPDIIGERLCPIEVMPRKGRRFDDSVNIVGLNDGK